MMKQDMRERLLSEIGRKSAKVGVIGLGYVGLPLIRAFVNAGFSVTDHTAYDYEFILKHARLIVNTRNAMRSVSDVSGKIRKA